MQQEVYAKDPDDRVSLVTRFVPSEFRLYHPINPRCGVYKVSGILFAAPLFETVKDHEPPGSGQAYSVDGTHQRST